MVRWLPAVLMMLAIFLYSAGQALDVPQSFLRLLVNKSGHIIGYAMLALSYWRVFDFQPNRRGSAWLLAILYALTDEIHQSFVPGRHPSLIDVLVYDNLGAFLSMWLASLYQKQKQPGLPHLAVDEEILAPESR